MMNKITVIGFVVLCMIALPSAVFAYTDATADKSLERMLAAQKAVEIAKQNKGAGSGTPYFALDGVAGASAISAAVFGGIGAIFFLKGRNGRYVAQGRG
ncbi:conserved exported hypothetical protein [Candidatus Nitrosotenuis uzonensis]|uniref:PDGLE domain-containing protein n=2 Tax=Candidatus Nitrosotenuis uzonensis TaxID=1407055 RepID=A0A812F651_9ARCH|nr:conserved exported hypothetical protein [Candidatus Nitrosotenuis uzonensis]